MWFGFPPTSPTRIPHVNDSSSSAGNMSSTPYMPHDRTLHLQMGQQDFGMLLQLAVMSTCGGRSFRVQWVVDICTRFAPYLSQHDRTLIADAIARQRKEGLGDHHDADMWLELMRYMQSLKNVTVSGGESISHDDAEAIPNQHTANTGGGSE